MICQIFHLFLTVCELACSIPIQLFTRFHLVWLLYEQSHILLPYCSNPRHLPSILGHVNLSWCSSLCSLLLSLPGYSSLSTRSYGKDCDLSIDLSSLRCARAHTSFLSSLSAVSSSSSSVHLPLASDLLSFRLICLSLASSAFV